MPTESIPSGIVTTILPATPYAVPPGPHRILFSTASASYSATVGGVYTALTNPMTEPGYIFESGFIRNDAGGNRLVLAKKVSRLDTYAGKVAQSNPLLYWRFNEKTGNTLYDSLYTLSHLTKGSAVVLGATGPLADGNTGITLDGTINSVSSLAGAAALSGASACSFEVWCNNPVWAPATHEVIFSFGSVGIYLSVQAAKLFMSLHSGGVQWTQESVASVDAAQWVHLAGTWESGDFLRLYINGRFTTGLNTTLRTGTLTATTGYHIGAFGGTSLFYSGSISDLAVYTRKLSADAIAEHYAAKVYR